MVTTHMIIFLLNLLQGIFGTSASVLTIRRARQGQPATHSRTPTLGQRERPRSAERSRQLYVTAALYLVVGMLGIALAILHLRYL
jgi:hypothetical protein